MHKKVDFILVGQGLAGSLLAFELIQQDAAVLVIDQHHQHSSSKVAAGLVNPLTGKRLSVHSLTEQFLESAHQRYASLGEKFSEEFFHAIPMLRLLKDQQQQEAAQKKLHDPAFSRYLDTENELSQLAPKGDWHMPWGALTQQQTGYLDIPLLLTSIKQFLIQQQALIQTRFTYVDMTLAENQVTWNGYQADCCIFCEGYQAMNNPWFDFLPFQPAKGEILTLQSDSPDESYIVNKGNWLVPIGNQQFRCGSTNEWTFQDDHPTKQGRQKIEQGFKQLFNRPPGYQVVNHQAGIRPATRDKNPFIGRHPQKTTLAMFNGFGARGSLTIPYYSTLFARHLVQHAPLPDDVNIQRHYAMPT